MDAPRSESRSSRLLLPLLMCAGAALGFLAGGLWGGCWKDPAFAAWRGLFRLAGDVFMSLLQLLVVPLVVCGVIHAMAGMGDLRRGGRIFLFTMAYFFGSMFLASATGLVLVNVIQPGASMSSDTLARDTLSAEAGAKLKKIQESNAPPSERLYDLVRGMFPKSLVQAALEMQILGLILFAIVFGAILGTLGERGARAAEFIGTLNAALMIFVQLAIWLAPLGILGLVAETVGAQGGPAAIGGLLSKLSWYAGTVVPGLLIHGFVTLPLILFLFGKRRPLAYARGMGEALLTAFTTASSAATLPVTVRCLKENNGVRGEAVDLVAPLGTTANMNGTALYEAVAALFIAQVYDVPLGLGGQIIVLLTSILAAFGAAAIPGAGLVTLVLVLTAAGLPTEGLGLILSIDWLVDRCRTTVNVWDDGVGSAIVDRLLEPAQKS